MSHLSNEQMLDDYKYLYSFVFIGCLGDLQTRCKQNIKIAKDLVNDDILTIEQYLLLKDKIVDFYKICISKELKNPTLE